MYSQADYDQIFVPFDELDRKPSPHVSESTASVNSASAVEEGASVIPSTRITSQSPDIPPADPSMDHLPRNRLNEVDSLTQPTFDASDEEQIRGWVTALQRLVKGKVHVQEEVSSRISLDMDPHNTPRSYVGSRDVEHHPRGNRIHERQPGRKRSNGQSECKCRYSSLTANPSEFGAA